MTDAIRKVAPKWPVAITAEQHAKGVNKSLFSRGMFPWKPFDDKRLRAFYSQGMPAKEIADILGRTVAAVRQRITALGIAIGFCADELFRRWIND